MKLVGGDRETIAQFASVRGKIERERELIGFFRVTTFHPWIWLGIKQTRQKEIRSERWKKSLEDTGKYESEKKFRVVRFPKKA